MRGASLILDMVDSMNGGPQARPPSTLILLTWAPKKGAEFLENTLYVLAQGFFAGFSRHVSGSVPLHPQGLYSVPLGFVPDPWNMALSKSI